MKYTGVLRGPVPPELAQRIAEAHAQAVMARPPPRASQQQARDRESTERGLGREAT